MPAGSSSGATATTPGRAPLHSPASSHGDRDWKRWRQQQRHDYNTHQFLDASATVHAGLFAARRLPEIDALWRRAVRGALCDAAKAGAPAGPGARRPGQSGGGKLSARHLRRRAGSHRPRRRRRAPQGAAGGDAEGEGEGEGKGEAAVASDATVGEEPGSLPRSEDGAAHGGSKKRRPEKTPCRRARRRPALLRAAHSGWWQPQAQDHATGAHHWTTTHLWHAKRFHVSPPLFSWSIPLVHAGRGARASLRLASCDASPKCTIQDGTWEVNGCAITLEVSRGKASARSERPPMSTIVALLRRLCGSEASFLEDDAVIAGRRAGEGLIHEIDAHPLRPVGPATFIFGGSGSGSGSGSDDDSERAHLSILAHPAIHRRIRSLLTAMLPGDVDTGHVVTISTAPLVLLRIRGRAATPTLREVLGQADHISLSDDNGVNHGTLIKLRIPPSLILDPTADDRNGQHNEIVTPSSLLLRSHQPNQSYQHLTHNLASSGWDIVCHTSVGSALFQTFVRNGGACAIGLIEDTRARTEAFPPLPIFPRDYPDTAEGQVYWGEREDMPAIKREVEEDCQQCMRTWQDWAIVRTCLEGSWGRVNTLLKKTLRGRKRAENGEKSTAQETIPSQKLTTKSEVFGRDVTFVNWMPLISAEATSTIVVRGSFGIPFVQLLHGCGSLAQTPSGSKSTGNARHRRPRRKVRPPFSRVCASPLSRKDAEAHSALCQQFRSSLSLPALLRCEFSCEGKGTLNTGDLIFPATSCGEAISTGANAGDGTGKAHKSPLGVVVSGGFSPSRGRCHGVGFVGAAKLIDTLDGTSDGVGMMIPQHGGQKMMALKVSIWDGCDAKCTRYALLSILL